MAPSYDITGIISTGDTLNFPLNGKMFYAIKSTNLFVQNGEEYISFLDKGLEDGGESVNIYQVSSGKLIKKLFLKPYFSPLEVYRATAYTRNFDSIYVINDKSLTLMDSAGNIKFSFKYPGGKKAWSYFGDGNPPVFTEGSIFAGIRPYLDQYSFKDLRKWKTLYKIDLRNRRADLYYDLPGFYHEKLYGYQLLAQSYCYNDSGRFVFSFPADPDIYETDLSNYHNAYYGKSMLQQEDIEPLCDDELGDNHSKKYLIRDSYGPIFYDAVRKRYLRVAKHKISEVAYEKEHVRRNHSSIIIFDRNFRIIGESPIDYEIAPNTLFFTADGSIYVRTGTKDRDALHFVRLAYLDDTATPAKLAIK